MSLADPHPGAADALHRARYGVAGFVDVETTGLSPQTEEVVELALVLFAFDREAGAIVRVVDTYVGLRDPGKPIPPEATRIHGITDADVRGKRLDDAKVLALLARCEFLVAHNAPFDRAFVTRLYPLAARIPWLCSMRDIDWYGKGCPSRSLQALLAYHGLKPARAHRGEADAMAALELLRRRDGSGVPYFTELLRAYEARFGADGERSYG